MRVALLESAQPHQVEVFASSAQPLLLADFLALQREGDIGQGCPPREQGVLLEDDGPVQSWSGHLLPIHEHVACGRSAQSAKQVQKSGLARAAGSNNRQELSCLDVQGDVLQRLEHPRLGQCTGGTHQKLLAHVMQADLGGHLSPPTLTAPDTRPLKSLV